MPECKPYATGYIIAATHRYSWETAPESPATLSHEDGRRYVFLGGYGERDRRPTQEGCEKIARWLDGQGLRETPLSITAALDAALAALGVPHA